MRYRGFDYQMMARALRPELAWDEQTAQDGPARQLELHELLSTDASSRSPTPGGDSGGVRRVFLDRQGENDAPVA